MPTSSDREYRMLLSPLKITKQEKRLNSDYYVEGYAVIFDKSYEIYEFDGVKYYEVIDRKAFDGADMSDVILQYDHSGKVLARKSNDTLLIVPDDTGLFVAADLSKSTAAKELFEEISNGLVTKMSWGFKKLEYEYNKETRTQVIKKVKKLYDVSAVSIPANDDTNISVRSFVQGRIEAEKQELLGRRKKKIKILKMLMEENL